MFIVEIGKGCWLAPWEGDPGRTLVIDSAKRFPSLRAANQAIAKAKRIRPASQYSVHRILNEQTQAPVSPAPAGGESEEAK